MMRILDTLARRRTISVALARAAASPADAARLITGYNLRALEKRVVGPAGRMRIAAHVRGRSGGIRVVPGPVSDYLALVEIFTEEQYRIEPSVTPRVIVDLGANVGFASLYFADLFAAAVIHAVEPDPDNLLRLRTNTAGRSTIRVHELAVGPHDGVVHLHRERGRGMSSSLASRSTTQTKIEVRSATLDSFLRDEVRQPVDLLKFDIEGAEKGLFETSASLREIPLLVGELHLDLTAMTLDDFDRLIPTHERVAAAGDSRRQLVTYARRA